MKNNKFEDYLDNVHANQYCGTDDLMPEDRIAWEEQLDKYEIIEFVDIFIEELYISKEDVEKLETYQVSTIPELLGKELIDKNKLT